MVSILIINFTNWTIDLKHNQLHRLNRFSDINIAVLDCTYYMQSNKYVMVIELNPNAIRPW